MKNIPFFDILFMIISGVVLIIIDFLGYSGLLPRATFIFILTAYFIGKYSGRIELRKKQKEEAL